MIYVTGIALVQVHKRAEWLQLIHETLPFSRAEAGCIAYSMYEDEFEPNRFLFFEIWESREVLALHFQMPHVARFMSEGVPMLTQKPEITIIYPEKIEKI
ncbi:MAG: antibiotic biosynthesis monooxygenase [Microscillaceae bacterium]|jgi:quinol monooxygenase YgiN|nr:antibiotic biosynthesis monooxygenase [Microscillaceae bacterium]